MFEELEGMEAIEKNLEEARLHLERGIEAIDKSLDQALVRIRQLHELIDRMAEDYKQETEDMYSIPESLEKALTIIHSKGGGEAND